MKNGLQTLQIRTGHMKKMHLEMKEGIYFSGNVALASLRSSGNLKRTKSSLTKNRSSPYFLLGFGI